MTRLIALSLASAALISAAHRPWPATGYLGWVALIPLVIALSSEKRWLRGALAGGFASLGTSLVAFEGVAPAGLWAYPVLVLLAAIAWAAAGALYVLIANRLGGNLAVLLSPALLVAAEFVPAQRALLGDFANGMGAFGYTQFGTPLLAAAGWSGVSGVSFLAICINAAVLLAWRRAWLPTLGLLALPFLAVMIPTPGAGQLNTGVAPLNVAVVQGAVQSVDTLFARFDRQAAERMMGPYSELTAGAAEHGADLVVWGETTIPHAVRPGHVPDYLIEALAPAPVALLGGVSFTGERSYNSIFHWQEGELTEVYRKRALVPFNERHYTAGRALPPLDVNGARVGLGICLDTVFGSLTREAVAAGAELLVFVTEDSFAMRTVTPELHLRVTAFRAAETARYVVFANQSGPSGIIDQRGRIIDRIEHGEAAALVAAVPAYGGITPFVRFGDWVGMLSVLLLLTGVTAAIWLPTRGAARPF